MWKNKGKFIDRETDTYENGDRAITDTFMLKDGTLMFHTYNVSADGKEHSHQVMDENGNNVYCRGIGSEHSWTELDRMMAMRWLSTLSQENLNMALNIMNIQELQFVSDMIYAYNQTNIENITSKRKVKVK